MPLASGMTTVVMFAAGAVPVVAALALSIFIEKDGRKKIDLLRTLCTFVVFCLFLLAWWRT